MALATIFLATLGSEGTFAGAGGSWWQTVGGLLAVFALLLISLKLLGKWNRRQGSSDAGVLTVWHLGPKREIQVLRLGEDVHYIYRHENAMVLLKQGSLAEFQARRQADGEAGGPAAWQRFFPHGLPFSGQPGNRGDSAPDLTSS